MIENVLVRHLTIASEAEKIRAVQRCEVRLVLLERFEELDNRVGDVLSFD